MSTKPKLTAFRCAICGRRLREGRYVFSRFTKSRYCIPGPGCKKKT